MTRSASHGHQESHERALIPPLFQMILILFTSVILAFLIHHRLTIFRARDPIPHINEINPKTFREFGSFASEVSVGLYIDEYENFNLADNNFLLSGTIWFLFDPGIISMETIEKFTVSFGQILYKSAPHTRLVNDKLFVRYNVRIQHSSTLDLADFPMDNHRIFLEIDNEYVLPSEILFASNFSYFTARSNSEIFGWNQRDTTVKTGYEAYVLDPFDAQKTANYPLILFLIEYARSSVQQVVTIFLPLLLIFYVILFVFSIREGSTSVSLSAGCVTGILAYRFVIANISPKVGYFMLSDYIFFLFLAMSIVVFLLNISDIYYHRMHLLAKKCVLMAIHIAVNLITAYLLFA